MRGPSCDGGCPFTPGRLHIPDTAHTHPSTVVSLPRVIMNLPEHALRTQDTEGSISVPGRKQAQYLCLRPQRLLYGA